MVANQPPPSAAHGSRLAIAIALGTVYVVWGSTYLAIRFAIETLPPLWMGSMRFLVAGGVLYAWARARGAPRPQLRQWRAAALIGALLLLVGNGGVVLAERRVSSGIAALLVAMTPLWLTLLGWLFGGEPRPRAAVWLGLAGGFLGTGLLVSPRAGAGAVDPSGAALVLMASLSWTIGSLYSRRAPLPASPTLVSGMEMLCGGALLAVAGLLHGEAQVLTMPSARSLWALAYLAVFGSIAAFTAYAWLLRVASPSLIGTYAYVNPVVALLLGWALAGEAITPRMLLASGAVIASVVLIVTGRARPKKPTE